MRTRTAIAGVTIGAIALGIASLAVLRGWLPLHPLAAHRYGTWGIDVSHHQGAIDWTKVASERRLRFAYLKATEGGDFTDPRFAENWREARRAGLRVGAYHFFSFCRPGVEQARHFLAVVPQEADALPPALDLELGEACARRPSRDEVSREVASWLAEVERGTGKRPLLYATAESYDLFVRGRDLSPPLWMRDVLGEPAVDAPHAWVVWQFWPRGRVAGIRGPVDLNAARGDLDARAPR